MCLDFVMNIPLNMSEESERASTQIPPEKCSQYHTDQSPRSRL